MQKKNSSGIEPAPPDQKPGALTTTPGNHHLMFLTPCYNDFIYVYKYACLVKLKYLEYQVNWTCTRPYFKSIPQPFAIAVRVVRTRPQHADDSTARWMRIAHHVRPFFGNDSAYRWPKWAPAHGQQLRPQMSSTCISGLYHLEK